MPAEIMHTYQALAIRFGVDPKTIYRWFKKWLKFKPTRGTVRISESQVQQFIEENSKHVQKFSKKPTRTKTTA